MTRLTTWIATLLAALAGRPTPGELARLAARLKGGAR